MDNNSEDLCKMFPLSSRQERMYFMQLANPESRAFNLSVVINLKTKSGSGLPDDIPDKIQSAMNVLVKRHDALRVTICSHPTDKTMAQATSHSCAKLGSVQVAQKLNNPNKLDICTFKGDSDIIQCNCGAGAGQRGCDSCTLREEIFKPFDMSKQLFQCAVFTNSKEEITLCLVFHHLITDGMSLFVLSSELLGLLRADSDHSLQRAVANSDTNPAPQLARIQAEDPIAKKRFIERWVALLSNAESCTNFSSNQYHGQQQPNAACSHAAEDVLLELSDKSSRSISHLSQVYRVSPAVVIATMYTLALHHFTGEWDIIIGMVSSNRSNPMKNTVGYFANTLPLRVNLNSAKASNLQSLMKEVRKNWSMILAGGIDLLDLVPLVPCLQHNKSSGRESSFHSSPLQVLFSFYDVGEGRALPSEFTVSGVEINCEVKVPKPGHTHADLWMEANPNYVNGNGKRVFHWEYRLRVLTHFMVEYLHTVLCRYLEATADAITQGNAPCNPLELSIPTSDLSLSQVEGSKVFKNTEIQDTSHLCYIQRFEQKCQERPDSPAFRLDSDSVYTYSDVQNMVAAIALFLIKTHNVSQGDRVALLLPRDPNLYLVVLAVLKCGAAYVPVTADTAQSGTEDRLLKIFKVANTKLLLTVKSTWSRLPTDSKITGSVVYLDDLLANLSQHKGSNLSTKTDFTVLADLEARYTLDLLFYILFTSGTTGEPKAVGITNANLNTTFNNFLHLLTPEETRLTLAATGINFDSHILDSFAPLLNGACLVVAKSALDLADALQDSHDFDDSGVSVNTSTSSSSSYYDGITFTFATPSTASVVDFPSSMQAIMIGGEVFTKACYQKTKHIPRVLNIYGPTECSVFMTAIEVPKLPSSRDISSTVEEISRIGWPLPDVKVMILNEAKRIVPVGRVGELHIAGPVVSSVGYLNAAETSKRSFFPNPANPEETVYATGDLMYMLPNRMLQFVGRKDGQVKLRGMRIHLQEVTNALSSHPDVQYATSLVINPSTPSATLVSFVSPKKVDKSSLLAHVRHRLPSYMVPSLIITDDELIHYKLSKDYVQSRAQKAIEEASREQDNYMYPKYPDILSTASKIAALFGKVLDVRDYPLRGDFFAFGGHSLLCFQLLKEINQEMRVRLSLTHIMQNSTPLALTGVVVELKNKQEPLELHCVSHSNSQANTPASNIHQPTPHQSQPCNGREAHMAPVGAENKFDYLEPVPDFPLGADLEDNLTQLFKGHSVSSVEIQTIADTLAEETGFYIPSNTLVHYDSMEALQAHLKLKTVLSFTSRPQRVAVTLQPPISAGENRPIFFIHSGIIGWSLSYAKLAKRLGTYSVAIQRTPEAPVSSFEDMAAFYLEELQSIQPKGPYRLVGVCYGAYLVYELMRQLIEKGERVELAFLINNSPVNENRPIIFNEQGLPLPNTMAHPFYFYESNLKLKLRDNKKLVEEHNSIDVNLDKLTTGLLEAYPWLPFSTSELAKAYEEFVKTLKPAWFDYTPEPIENVEMIGKVVLIRNKEHPFFKSHDYGLHELLNGSQSLNVVTSPRKLGLLNEEGTVQFIGDKIRGCMPIAP